VRNLTKTNKLKIVLELQGLMIIYSLANIFAKLASGRQFLSLYFVLFYGLEIVVLGVYAILWQQVIKKIDLSVAYMNRSVVLLWSMLWAVLFFKESVTIGNLAGMVLVILGTIVVNSDE